MRQKAKEYPSLSLGNRLYIRLGLYSPGKTFHTPCEEKEDYLACMLRKRSQNKLFIVYDLFYFLDFLKRSHGYFCESIAKESH